MFHATCSQITCTITHNNYYSYVAIYKLYKPIAIASYIRMLCMHSIVIGKIDSVFLAKEIIINS